MSITTSVSDLINQIQTNYGTKEQSTGPGNDLDKDAFLSLLVTQMQYQDPLEPTTNEEYLAQMAQFSALEQMQNLNSSYSMQQAYSLVGKTVMGLYTNEASSESEYVTGIVDYASLKSGKTYVTVDGKDIPVAGIEMVFDDASTDAAIITEAIEEINESLSAINDKLEELTTQVNGSSTTESAVTEG